ncbi:MAG TPA: hypothetical protein H9870_06915 [Candidatus Corynebacterium avicola]|uniref:Uncharacterized protein n=1 Tax=Candidatus Corynebacterium avicola TaxID=2838527 RepID=A0A9D1RQG7_9CORY|nr:hypothetical protein [Candidatus Corynebacterium avicola]
MGDYQGCGETAAETSGNTRLDRQARFEPVPGLVYLRRPRGGTVVRQDAATATDGTERAAAPSPNARKNTAAGDAVARRVAMLVGTWLEVVDGLRPVTVLRKGPFSPVVSEQLRGVLRDAGKSRRSPSRVLSVNLPPTHRDRLGFTASVTRDGRVKAVAGHLARYDGQWRVESITLI